MTIAFTSMLILKSGVAQSQGLDEKPKFSFGLKLLTKFVALIGAAQNNMRDAVVDNSGLKYSLPKESYEIFDYTPPVSRISDTVSAMSKQVRVGQMGADTPAAGYDEKRGSSVSAGLYYDRRKSRS